MSDNISLYADSGHTDDTGQIEDNNITESNVSGTNVPLVLASAYDEYKRKQHQVLPHLPSHRYRYTVWHELSRTVVSGDKMHAPRIREGPPEKEEMFNRIRDNESKKLIHHSRTGKEKLDYRDTTENWENTIVANLSYQDLQHEYQKTNFFRVLRRLKNVEQLNLQENKLEDWRSVTFPKCTHLNLSRNFIGHFKYLPKLPCIKHLQLFANNIVSVEGLAILKKSPIESLNLKQNQVAFTLNYRQRVFQILPQLKVLDDVPYQLSDSEFVPEENPENKSTCVIS